MDRRYIEEHQVVARYLAGQLSSAERDEFEVYCLENPDIDDEMRLTEQFKTGLREAVRRNWITPVRGAASFAGSRYYALAASIVAAVAVGWLVFAQREIASSDGKIVQLTRQLEALRSGQLPTRVIRFASTRSGAAIDTDIPLTLRRDGEMLVLAPEIVLVCADGQLRLECEGGAEPSVPEYPRYRVHVRDGETGEIVWQSDVQNVDAGAAGPLFALPSSALRPGSFVLTLEGISDSGATGVTRYTLSATQQ